MNYEHSQRRKGRIWKPALAILIVVLLAAGGFSFWLFRTADRTARDAAHTIGVTIPANADHISARDDRIALGGTRCSGLRFLIPTGQWPHYADQYFPNGLGSTFSSHLSCSGSFECTHRSNNVGQNFEATVDEVGGKMRRTIVIVPECTPGRTLIMLKTVR